MPWCDGCSVYHAPTALVDGCSCPECGRDVDPIRPAPTASADRGAEPVPWHFWLMVLALAAYLLWRAVQGILLLV